MSKCDTINRVETSILSPYEGRKRGYYGYK